MPPALILLADASTGPGELAASLDAARQVPGVARVLLFHPAEIENDLARRSLGFRLWPQEGDTAGAPSYDELVHRAGQLRVRLVEL